MQPAPPSVPHACKRRLSLARGGAFALALLLVQASESAHAQEGLPQPGETVAFEADRVEYRDDSDAVVAIGNVLLKRGDQSVRADTVTYSTTSGEIVAAGNVRLVDQDGNQLYTDSVTLDDEFRAGAMENMLLALREGGRLAARSGTRNENGSVTLNKAAYSACEVEDKQGCSKTPTWRITAKTVVYDPATKVVRFRGARLELFGASLIPLPGLSVTTDGRAVSGLLVPAISFTPSNGVELRQSWYQAGAEPRPHRIGLPLHQVAADGFRRTALAGKQGRLADHRLCHAFPQGRHRRQHQ